MRRLTHNLYLVNIYDPNPIYNKTLVDYNTILSILSYITRNIYS